MSFVCFKLFQRLLSQLVFILIIPQLFVCILTAGSAMPEDERPATYSRPAASTTPKNADVSTLP